MSVVEDRRETDRDIEQVFGLNPEFFQRVPDYLLPTEWASFKSLMLSDQTAIPNKYKELIGLAVSGATRCRYCAYLHAEAARLFGATEDEITETALVAKHTMGWSTYLNTLQFDYDQFTSEFDQIAPTSASRRLPERPPEDRAAAGPRRKAGSQPPAARPPASRSRARSKSLRTPSRISTACSAAARVLRALPRAPSAQRPPGPRAPDWLPSR